MSDILHHTLGPYVPKKNYDKLKREFDALKKQNKELQELSDNLKKVLEYHSDDYVKQVGTWKIVQRLEEQVDTLTKALKYYSNTGYNRTVAIEALEKIGIENE